MKLNAFILLLLLVSVSCAPQPTATPEAPSVTPPTLALEPTPLMTATPSAPTVEPTPLPTARPRFFEDIDARAILASLLGDLPLTEETDGYWVLGNPDWKVWVNDRDEGHVTQKDNPELVAVVSNVIGANPPPEAQSFAPSGTFLALFVRDETTDELLFVRRETVFPNIAPLTVEIHLPRVVDVDHDGQDEILLTTSPTQSPVRSTEAQLLRWDGERFRELWRGTIGSDNTAAATQDDYKLFEGAVDFADLDSDGTDEIIVNGKTTHFGKDAQGNANLDAVISQVAEHQVFKWNGSSFALAPSLQARIPTLSP